MIEAVSSVIMNASLLRSNADQSQQDRLSSLAVSTTEGEGVELQLAPYVSPFIEIDTNFKKAVLQIRDSSTGEVQRQFPSETTMRARAAQAEIDSQTLANVQSQSTSSARTSNESDGANVSNAPGTQSTVNANASPSVATNTPAVSSGNVQSQIAVAAFASGALSGAASSSSSLSVFA